MQQSDERFGFSLNSLQINVVLTNVLKYSENKTGIPLSMRKDSCSVCSTVVTFATTTGKSFGPIMCMSYQVGEMPVKAFSRTQKANLSAFLPR